MAKKNVSEFLVDRLYEWGIDRVFGYPGDGINGVMGALDKAQDKIRFIQVRHEEMAAFMACAHAKFTGEVGVCIATSGPGAIHLLNGLYDAKMDHQPVLAIVGQQATSSLGGSYQQEVDLLNLFKDVAHEFVQMVSTPKQVRHLIDRAIRIAKDQRTVSCVIIPNDIQIEDAVEQQEHEHSTIHTGIGFPESIVQPREEEIIKAAEILNMGKKVAILAGAGALHAREELKQVAELLGAGVAKALLGKAVLSDTLPYVTGSIGLLGTRPSYDLMMDCDTLLMVGSSFPYPEFLPKEGQARGIQIDVDGRMLSIRYPMELNLKGDSKATLSALIPHLIPKEDRSWREMIEKNITTWWKVMEERAMMEANPINPQRIFWELSPKLPQDVILTGDAGSVANWYARDLKLEEGMMASLSGNLATMGPGVPYAIAAKFTYPHRPVIAMVGDGAMQMNGNNGLITISKYWKEWKNPTLIVLVLNNRDLNMVTWEQRVMAGDPKFTGSQMLPDFPYAKYAESLGLRGIKVTDPGQISYAWDELLHTDRPAVLEAVVDPDVPPLPPHITFDNAVNYMKALINGDPDRGRIILQSIKQKVAEFKS